MTAPLEALPLVRRITEHAYRAGGSLVTTLFTDEEATLMRFRYAPDESFDRASDWLQEGLAAAFRSGAARLAIAGANPVLLAREDPAKVARANLRSRKRADRHSTLSRAMKSTGPLSRMQRPLGPSWCFRMKPKRQQSRGFGMQSLLPRASIPLTPLELGGHMTHTCKNERNSSIENGLQHFTFAGQVPTCGSDWQTTMPG